MLGNQELEMIINKVKASMNIGWRPMGILCIVSLLSGGALGVAVDHAWNVSVLKAALAGTQAKLDAEKAKPPVLVPVKGEVRTETQIAYVPKPTYVYIDPKTGHEVTKVDDTDLQAAMGRTDFKMTLIGANGATKNFAFTTDSDEKYMFEKNRIDWNQMTTVSGTLDVREMMEEYAKARIVADRPHVNLGGYLTNQGAMLTAGVHPSKRCSINGIVSVPDTHKLWGAGIQFAF